MHLKFSLKTPLCLRCKNMKDKGLHKIIRYSKNKQVVLERFDVRFYCKKYNEFLKTMYEMCSGFEEK